MRVPALQRQLVSSHALRAAVICVIVLPVALLHARAVAEILIGITDALFLLHVWAERDRAWLRSAFVQIAAGWWLWQVLCSALGTGGLVLALVAFRLPLFAVALGAWVLGSGRARRALWWVLAAAAAWLVLESWQQYLTGTNVFGAPPYGDGALTGPFARPRAGPALILILFPVLVPASLRLLADRRRLWRAAGVFTGVLGVATVPLIAQRMPTALLLLGLALTAALLPRLRAGVAVAAFACLLLVAAAPALAPAAYQKLVVRTHEQVVNFSQSPYGELWVRAAVIAERHPWRGLGVDGFRRGCADPGAIRGMTLVGVTDTQARQATDACNIHPHNYYLEEADTGGVPLVVLFTAMVGVLMWRLARGLRAGLDPLRTGLLVAISVAFWPIASTSALMAMPNAGWIFLLAGFGLAEADAAGSGGNGRIPPSLLRS